MTKLGATILSLIVLAIVGFATMVSFGPSGRRDAVPPRVDPVPQAAVPAVRGGDLVIPVAGVSAAQLVDTWGDSRAGGQRLHQAIDIMAPGNTPVIAAAAGTVEKLFNSHDGGLTLYVRSPDRRWSHYYAHLAGYAPGMREGLKVAPGTLLGFVGDTGNAGAGNTHLHYGISRKAPGDSWHGGVAVNPYPLLAGGDKVR